MEKNISNSPVILQKAKTITGLLFILSGSLAYAQSAMANIADPWISYTQGWIYPGEPACAAPDTFTNEKIYTLKPEYFTVTSKGALTFLTVQNAGCNGYSAANVALVKANSVEQFVTVSAGYAAMKALVNNAANVKTAISTLTQFVKQNCFTGVEIDFEGYWSWTAKDYTSYLSFITQLGDALHANGAQLMIDGPASSENTSSRLQWKYKDFENLPVDYLVLMAYDNQYDLGNGTSISPTAWAIQSANWVQTQISDSNRIVVGIPSYGYHGVLGEFTLAIDTYKQTTAFPGMELAKRDKGSFEMQWSVDNMFYTFVDEEGLNNKRAAVEAGTKIPNISVWHLGGNKWFSGRDEPSVPKPWSQPYN